MKTLTKFIGIGTISTIGMVVLIGFVAFWQMPTTIQAIDLAIVKPTRQELKQELVTKIRNRRIVPVQYQDFQNWITEFNTENKRCRFVLRNVTQENLLDKLNDALERSC